jgi:hypothetical protein
LPQPGPIEPAPTTIAILPLSRSIRFSPDFLLSFAHAHGGDISTNRMPENLR